MDVLNQFLTFPMIAFCLVVSVLVSMQRRVLELAWPKIKENVVWRDLFLPLTPAITGGLLGWAVKVYPFPDNLTSSFGRIACGVFCGLASGIVYRIVKKFLTDKLAGMVGQNVQATSPAQPGVQNTEQKDPDDLSQV